KDEYDCIQSFFFSSRRRHTRCYRDWSSDVCSSDLNRLEVKRENQLLEKVPFKPWVGRGGIVDGWIAPPSSLKNRLPLHLQYSLEIGRASCRERVRFGVVEDWVKREDA